VLLPTLTNLNYSEILTVRKVPYTDPRQTENQKSGNQVYILFHCHHDHLSCSLTATHADFGKHFWACRTCELHKKSVFCCSVSLHNHLFLKARVIQHPFASSLWTRN